MFGGEGAGGQEEGTVTQAAWAQIMKDVKGRQAIWDSLSLSLFITEGLKPSWILWGSRVQKAFLWPLSLDYRK